MNQKGSPRSPCEAGFAVEAGFAPILIVVVITVLVGGYLLYQNYQNQSKPTPLPTTQLTPTPTSIPESTNSTPTSNSKLIKKEIPRICGEKINYQTNLEVQNEIDAQHAFQKYVDYMKTNKIQDANLAVDWIFAKVEYAGYYKEIPYWMISFYYAMSNGEKGNSQTYVNQKGDVANLSSCI